MGTQISAQDVFELSQAFHNLSVALGNFRYANWNELTPEQRIDLESKQWTLFNTSSDLNAKSVVLKVELIEAQLQVLRSCTVGMKASAEKISDIKHAIGIAAKAVAFGGTIYLAASTGDIGTMLAAATSLTQEMT